MAMQPEPFSLAYLIAAFMMWSIMMVAMMVPSAAPMILLRARVDRAPSAAARHLHTLLFALGYILVWTGFSLAAAIAQAALVASGSVAASKLAFGSRSLAGALLLVAAGYELMAAKRLCLDKCQAPLLFIVRYFRPGAAGAFRLGLIHGFYCLGCCWALMLLLFVGGVMNLAWVAFLGILVLGEKLVLPRVRAERLVAGGLFAGGIVLLIA
jgi:predicted metal-binding membrane protein